MIELLEAHRRTAHKSNLYVKSRVADIHKGISKGNSTNLYLVPSLRKETFKTIYLMQI